MIKSKKKYWKNDQSRDRKKLFSKPMGGGKTKKLQNEVNQLNMVQEWDKEVFDWRNNLKHNNDKKKC